MSETIINSPKTELESIQRIHADLGNAIEKLSKEHAFQQALLEYASMIIIATNNDGVITFMNHFAEKSMGYSKEEVEYQSTPLIFLHAKELHRIGSFRRLIGMQQTEWTFITKEGKEFICDMVISPILKNGQVSGYLFIGQDVTDKKQFELELKQRNEELTALEEELRQNLEEMEATHEELMRNQIELQGQLNALHNAALVSETDIRGNIIFANETFARISGYTVEELIGKNHRILKSGLQSDEIFVEMWQTISSGKVWRGIICNKKKNGDYYWVKSTITPVLDKQGIPVKYIGVRFEITEQVQQQLEISQKNEELTAVEEELRQNLEEMEATHEELMRNQIELQGQLSALHNAALVSETDIRGNIIFANETFARISGYTVEELIGKNHRILKSGQQPDEIFVEMWETISSGKVWRGIICNKKKDGDYYWVKSTITPVLDKQGIPVKYIGVRFEITEQVKQQLEISQKNDELRSIEEELRQNLEEMEATHEELMRNQVELQGQLNALHNAAIVSETDIRGNIIFANETFARISGYTVEELMGKNHRILKSGQQPDEIFVEMWETISSGKVWRGIICNKKKNGDYYWVKSTITPVLDKQGIPVKYIGVRFEITEQVELQKTTAEQSMELKKSFAQMLQNEKMATLGQLVAGVAHEINTPIGAINAAATNIKDNLVNVILLMIKNIHIIEQYPNIFSELCSYLLQDKNHLNSKEIRQLKKNLASILESHQVANASEIAAELASIAFTIDIEPYIDIFKLQNAEILNLLFSIGKTSINTQSIGIAVKKTQKIISALKSYTYRRNYEQKEEVNINDTIENILTLYHNQTKHNIELVTEFQELPMIKVSVDEIGQVWNNIIVNALQAMKYQGRLIIQTYSETDKIIVKIIDNGPGIPKEIQDKIFEPFFTTKPQGEGTGLGLDICRKIIEEKHHGKIEVFSEPGCTCFTVILPIVTEENYVNNPSNQEVEI